MSMGVFDFKSIRLKVERLEQKAEFEAKNPKPVEAAPVVWSPEWGYGTATPYVPTLRYVGEPFPEPEFGWREDSLPVTSLAHPEWPYTGTPHEWPKFKV